MRRVGGGRYIVEASYALCRSRFSRWGQILFSMRIPTTTPQLHGAGGARVVGYEDRNQIAESPDGYQQKRALMASTGTCNPYLRRWMRWVQYCTMRGVERCITAGCPRKGGCDACYRNVWRCSKRHLGRPRSLGDIRSIVYLRDTQQNRYSVECAIYGVSRSPAPASFRVFRNSHTTYIYRLGRVGCSSGKGAWFASNTREIWAGRNVCFCLGMGRARRERW